jgi:septum formation protein
VHTVYTGLCVIAPGGGRPQHLAPTLSDGHTCCWLDLVASAVEVAPLSAAEIAAYVATGEPLDKAGAYGIQGLGGRLVRAVRGSYTAVVGLPLTQTHALLRAAGLADLDDPERAYLRWLQQQGKEPLPCPPTLP